MQCLESLNVYFSKTSFHAQSPFLQALSYNVINNFIRSQNSSKNKQVNTENALLKMKICEAI